MLTPHRRTATLAARLRFRLYAMAIEYQNT
jgi:hypothetical protein